MLLFCDSLWKTLARISTVVLWTIWLCVISSANFQNVESFFPPETSNAAVSLVSPPSLREKTTWMWSLLLVRSNDERSKAWAKQWLDQCIRVALKTTLIFPILWIPGWSVISAQYVTRPIHLLITDLLSAEIVRTLWDVTRYSIFVKSKVQACPSIEFDLFL